jgi:hypothetical protein
MKGGISVTQQGVVPQEQEKKFMPGAGDCKYRLSTRGAHAKSVQVFAGIA